MVSSTSEWLTAVATRQCPENILPALQPPARFGCPIPIDETVEREPVRYSPWSYPPSCLDSVANPDTKYCVFSNSRHGSNGVSMITTPETAANSVELLNERISAHWEPRRSMNNSIIESEPAYKVVPMPGKGRGVVATRLIRRAEPIMYDSASVVLDTQFPGSVRQTDGYELLHQAADQLADPELVLTLGRTNTMAADIVEDVLRTNSFSTPLAGEPHMGLFPEVSRINHACSPNAFTRFMPRSLAVSIIAGREIQPGEEITISYIPVTKPSAERQRLLSRWGFNCTCSLCKSSKSALASSDYRRTKIETMRQDVVAAVEARDGTMAVKLTHEVLRLARVERLEELIPEQYEILARIYWVAGDKESATKYAKMSLDVLEEQGYIDNRPEHLEVLLRSFDEDK
ncbi:uncharacterized protein BCR38DRAFT_497073 [Pseudomassariella vexata]|uniref:SET domain-containing protein n=1 Tax=Pseudomassariella vexata TaxID=1141098 RepID=A0A1Y2DNU6_9PEZI|nr:uncharacterized protein BCR38DRAFT_497073 [Pseudomassariella vexata]ORY60961.1 hypothetical protein BCR38DRAFT_497073 [Pseudomassariella vexata]